MKSVIRATVARRIALDLSRLSTPALLLGASIGLLTGLSSPVLAQSPVTSDPALSKELPNQAPQAGRGDGEATEADSYIGKHIVTLHAESALQRSGIGRALRSARRGARGNAAEPAASGQLVEPVNEVRKRLLRSSEFQRHRANADAELEHNRRALSTFLGRNIQTIHRFAVAKPGFSAAFTPSEVELLRSHPLVHSVEPVTLRELNADVSPTFLGADLVWSGAASGTPAKGAGMLVGVIDTGIQHDHASFAAVEGVVNPYGTNNFKGLCISSPELCNDKLVGLYEYEDEDFTPAATGTRHGTHVASLAVGNEVEAGGSNSPLPTIAGMAPLASLISYRACGQNCPGDLVLAAINQAIADGVDVLNLSFRGQSSPWGEAESLALLDATDVGIVVVATAGNDGPSAYSVSRLEPWVLTVGASSHDRKMYESVLTPVGGVNPPDPVAMWSLGEAVGSALSPLDVVYDDTDDESKRCNPPSALDYTNKIVLCDRKSLGMVPDQTGPVKAENLANLGAAAMVHLFFTFPNPAAIPLLIDPLSGSAADLRTWATGGNSPQAYISGTSLVQDPSWADLVPGFSSRGPLYVYDLLKPDLVAPGFQIMGAGYDGLGTSGLNGIVPISYEYGTSMAAPLVAGAAALLLELNPTLSPPQIYSMLRTSALHTGLRRCNGNVYPFPCAVSPEHADLFDYGSGRLQIDAAVNAGLTLDESTANFAAADPFEAGDPGSLNLPSLVEINCAAGCAFLRELDGLTSTTATWTTDFTGRGGAPEDGGDSLPPDLHLHVVPASFDLQNSTQQTIAIGVYADSVALVGNWQQAILELTPDLGGVSSARLPVAIRPVNFSASSDLAVEIIDHTGPFGPGTPISLEVRIKNLGPVPAIGAVVTVDLPPGTGAATWTCVPSGRALCADGVGAINDTVALFSQDQIVYTLTVSDTAGAASKSVTINAAVDPPSGLGDSDSENNTSAIQTNETIFVDGFEFGSTSAWTEP